VASPKLKAFKVEFGVWMLLNRFGLKAASAALSGEGPLAIHCDFFFGRRALYTKDGRLKKMDVSNRLKALHDAMGDALGIDDSRFTEISARKVVGAPGCRVEISGLGASNTPPASPR